MLRSEITPGLYNQLFGIRAEVQRRFEALRTFDGSPDDIGGKARLERVPPLRKRDFIMYLKGEDDQLREKEAWALLSFIRGEQCILPIAKRGIRSEITQQLNALRASKAWLDAERELATALGANPMISSGSLVEPTVSTLASERITAPKLVAGPAKNMLEELARFQCFWSGQTAPTGASIPLLVCFTFGTSADVLRRGGASHGYSFDLRHAFLRIELHRSEIDTVKRVDYERATSETGDVQLMAELEYGGDTERLALWRLSGGATLNGKFGYQAVGYADQIHAKDKAYLQVKASDIRVRLDDGGVLGTEAQDIAKQWLRIKKILNNDLPEDGLVNISEQGVDVE